MRYVLLILVLLAGCYTPTAPEPDEDDRKIEWPIREWRDTVIIFEP